MKNYLNPKFSIPALLTAACIIIAIVYGAWWHYMTAFIFGSFAGLGFKEIKATL